jgi:hypothetical protein
MAKARAKKQGQKRAERTRAQNRGPAPRRSSKATRAKRAGAKQSGARPTASRRGKIPEKLGISNRPLNEEIERQQQVPPRGTQRKPTAGGHELAIPFEPAPVRRRGRAQELEPPGEE